MAVAVTESGSDIVVTITITNHKTDIQPEFDAREAAGSLDLAKTWLVQQAINVAEDELETAMIDNEKTDAELNAEKTAIDDIKTNRVVAPDIGTP